MPTYSKNKQQEEQFPLKQIPLGQVAFIKSSYYTAENQNVI